MNVIYASRGNWIYGIDFEKDHYWCETSIGALKNRMSWANPHNLRTFNYEEFIICKGPYRNRNLLKHLQLLHPEWLL
jgi:hypothetical protein